MTRSPRTASARVAVLALLALSAAACGTRESTAAIVATERGGQSQVLAAVDPTGGLADGSTGAGAPTPGRSAAGAPTTGGAAVGTTGTAATTGGASAPGTAGGHVAGATGGSAGTTTGPATGGGTGGATGPAAPAAAGCARQGPPLKIGEVGAFSGLVGASIPGAVAALPVWVRYINANGGVGCHPVVLDQEDDQSNPAKSSSAVHKLAESVHVAAIVGSWVPLDVAGFRQAIETVKVPAIGGDMVNRDWNQSAWMFGVGGASRAQFVGSTAGLAAKGLKKVAVIYCVESTACTNYYSTLTSQGGAKRNGQTVVYTASTSLTQPDFTSQCVNAQKAGAQIVVAAGDDSYVQRVSRSCAGVNYFPVIALSATQGAFDATDPNVRKDSASLGSAVVPYMLNNTPALQAFHTAMKAYAPNSPVETTALTTWADGMMLKAAVEALGPAAQTQTITPAMVVQGLSKIRGETLGGLIPPTTFTAAGRSGSPSPEILCYYPVFFQHDGTFVPPNGNKYLCARF
jgi:ABC-type branched-subunit amino acid transport system substrate-binding protein